MLSWLLSWVLRLLGFKATPADTDINPAQSGDSAPLAKSAIASTSASTAPVKGPPATTDARPVVGPPQLDKLGDGDAYVEFEGKQRAARNVNFTQKADAALTARMNDTQATGKAVSQRFLGEQSADVRFKNADLHATEEDLNMLIKGGKSKWIKGQTEASIMNMGRTVLLATWEAYRVEGRNPSITGITAAALNADYEQTAEGLTNLKKFVITYLAVTNGEDAD